MDSAALRHRSSLLLFVGIAAGVYAAALAIVGSLPPLAARASVVAVAVALDMVVIVPAAFVFLVVRPRHRDRGVLVCDRLVAMPTS